MRTDDRAGGGQALHVARRTDLRSVRGVALGPTLFRPFVRLPKVETAISKLLPKGLQLALQTAEFTFRGLGPAGGGLTTRVEARSSASLARASGSAATRAQASRQTL